MKKTKVFVFCVALVMSCAFPLVADKKAGDPEKGKEVFQQCSVCHNADSNEKKMGPGLKGLFKWEKLTSNGKKVTEETVRERIDEGGNGMPAYKEMLEEDQKNDLIAYLKTL